MRPVLAILAFAVAVLVAPAGFAQFGPQGPPAVGVIAAERRPVVETAEFIGRVEPVERVDIRARVTGFLRERLFQEGEEVRPGQPLFRIESEVFQAEVARAEAQLAAAEAELNNAQLQLNRARELLRTAAGTQARLDDATAAERGASAQVMSARAALRRAQIDLAYTEIAAPVAGKIGRSAFSPGNVVGPDAGVLATIVSQDPMRVVFAVSQRQARELLARQASRGGVAGLVVRLRFADGDTHPHAGRIDFIDNQVDRNTDTILVRAEVPNPAATNGDAAERALVAGQFASVLVEGAEPILAITVPRAAILQDQQGTYLFVLDGEDRAVRRNVRLARASPELAVIAEGVAEGERVVVEGIQRVRPGQPVAPGPAGQRPPGPPAR
jgi:membrane fusion protein (multidrug efflux system)